MRRFKAWFDFQRFEELFDAIEDDAARIHSEFSGKMEIEATIEVAYIHDELRNKFRAIAELLGDDEDAVEELQSLFIWAYRAGGLGLGSSMAEAHPLAPKRVAKAKQAASGGKARGQAAKEKVATGWLAEAIERARRIEKEKPAIRPGALYEAAYEATTHKDRPSSFDYFVKKLREALSSAK